MATFEGAPAYDEDVSALKQGVEKGDSRSSKKKLFCGHGERVEVVNALDEVGSNDEAATTPKW